MCFLKSHLKHLQYISARLRVFFCVVTLSLPLTVFSQVTTDSLLQQLATARPDSNKVMLLNALSVSYLYMRPQQSLDYAFEADSLSLALGFERGNALSLNSMGAAYWSLGKLELGLQHFILSKELAHRLQDDYLEAKNLGNIGIIYASADNHASAIAHYRKALRLFKDLQHEERIAVTYNNLARSYIEIEQFDSAEWYLELALPIAEANTAALLPILYFKKADLYFRQKKYDEALLYLEKCKSVALQYDEQRSLIRSKQMLAEIRLKEGKVEEAAELAGEAARQAEIASMKELEYQTLATLSKTYAARASFDSAYYYLKLSIAHKDSLQKKEDQQKLNFMNYERQRREIDILTQENKMEQMLGQRARTQVYLLTGLLVLLVMLIVVLYRSRHMKNKANQLLQERNHDVKRQKEDYARQASQLQELNQMKDKLLSIISHDLKSPLNSISGSLDLVKEGLIDQQEFKMFLPELIKNVSYTNNLLDNLLHWARNQLEGSSINQEKINLKYLAYNKTELLRSQAELKNIRLQSEISQPIFVMADDIMIQIVLQNLISNAIKFCKSGDSITISAFQREEEGVLCVADTGMGISKEQQSLLFGRQSFTTRGTANEKGTGLGLILCKEFIDKNMGRIWVDSEPGKGSRFCFALPIFKTDTISA